MIRSFLKKGLGKILGGGDGAPTSPKAYPFNYDAAKGKAAKTYESDTEEVKSEPRVETAHGQAHSHSHDHAHAPEPAAPVEEAPAPVEEVPAPVVEEVAAAPETPEELELLSVAEIRRRLIDRGIKPRSKARKPELLDLLAGADGGGSGDEDAPAAPAPAKAAPLLDAVEIQELLDDMVRPALQADGGDIQLVEVIGNDVHVKLVGACTTCPSSILTMKMGVEALFKEEFPGFGELIQVNA